MRFEEWTYLWPPRPDKAVSKGVLHFYENLGWVAQVKLNGTCTVLGVAPDRSVRAMTRHNDDHKMWKPSETTAAAFKKLPGNGWYVFVSELMHTKVSGIRDINYIHDILVADGEHLIGLSLAARQALLHSLFKVKKPTLSHYVIDDHTWLVREYSDDFTELFEQLDRPEFEGLVLKNPKATLASCTRATSNSGWQVKSRKPLKNFNF